METNRCPFICPVCGGALSSDGSRAFCEKGHSFDYARNGVLNLLLSNGPKQKTHGDNRKMIRSRRAFLDRGYYRPLLDKLAETLLRLDPDGGRVLDAGCGECWYTAGVRDFLSERGITAEVLGVDISKDAVAEGARRNRALRLAVASAYSLPVAGGSCAVQLSLFAPLCPEEARRVLRPGGFLVRAFPLPRHLWGLKRAVYETPYENGPEPETLPGFVLLERQEIRRDIRLGCREDIENLFAMTPYFYKTSERDREKLAALSRLDTEIGFGVFVFQKAD